MRATTAARRASAVVRAWVPEVRYVVSGGLTFELPMRRSEHLLTGGLMFLDRDQQPVPLTTGHRAGAHFAAEDLAVALRGVSKPASSLTQLDPSTLKMRSWPESTRVLALEVRGKWTGDPEAVAFTIKDLFDPRDIQTVTEATGTVRLTGGVFIGTGDAALTAALSGWVVTDVARPHLTRTQRAAARRDGSHILAPSDDVQQTAW